MKLIDIKEGKKQVKAEKRKKAKQANAPEIYIDMPDGRYFKFAVHYQFKGKMWSFDIWAKTSKEAERRLFNIKKYPCDIAMVMATRPA